MLTIETGSGSATANSFISDADFTAWVGARYPSVDLKTATDREPHIIRAGDYLRSEARFRYRGLKKTAAQSMPYPRTGVVERGGQTIGDTEIPFRLKEAQSELAYLSFTGTDLAPALARGGQVASRTVGPISQSFFPGANPETVFPFVVGILGPLLRDGTDDALAGVPTLTALADVRGFMPQEFDPTEKKAS